MLVLVEDAAEAVVPADVEGCAVVRPGGSRRQVSTRRSVMAFILGIWTPLSAISVPASLSTVPDSAGYLPSRSRIRYLARLPASCRSVTRFLATWVTQD